MILIMIGTKFPGVPTLGFAVTLLEMEQRGRHEVMLCLPWGMPADTYLQADNENHWPGDAS